MGATGYLGSLLVPALVEAGHEVSALVRHPATSDGLAPPIAVHVGDATEPHAVRATMAHRIARAPAGSSTSGLEPWSASCATPRTTSPPSSGSRAHTRRE